MNNRQRSGQGFLIDLIRNNELSTEDLQTVSCPTLIMHSAHDAGVPVEHAYYAKDHISNSELQILDSWGHLIWIGKHAKQYDARLIDFLNPQPIT